MAQMDIPGYYYDAEKKKYFKIQANGAAPASSAYSSQDVKRRKTRDQKAEAREALMARQKGSIKRSRVARDPLAGGLIERAHGRRVGVDTADIVAAGLVPKGKLATSAIEDFLDCGDPLFDIEHRPDLGPSMATIRMAYDENIFSLRINADDYTRTTEDGIVDICHDGGVGAINRANGALWSFANSGESTSLSCHWETRTICMTWLAGTNDSGIITAPMPETKGEPIPTSAPPFRIFGFEDRDEVSFWCSTAAPPSSSHLFAFGTSTGITQLERTRWEPETMSPTQSRRDDVFAVEYLSDNPSILLSGSRSGILNLIDLRVPFKFNDADTITHPSSITHIKQLDSNRLLVSGLESQMCQYDLRFRKTSRSSLPHNNNTNAKSNSNFQGISKPNHQSRPRASSWSPPSSKSRPKKTPKQFTLPTLTYPSYTNTSTIHHGLDVDTTTGIIACAQESNEYDSVVELFSLHGGHKLESRVGEWCRSELGGGSGRGGRRVVKCVKWGEDGVGGRRSLYVGLGGRGIRRFAWGEGEGEGEDDMR